MQVDFPRVIFGYCKRCGGKGGDDPAASGADAPATDTVGNGIELEMFRGQALCQTCINTILNDEESLDAAQSNRETQRFLGKAGFKRRVY